MGLLLGESNEVFRKHRAHEGLLHTNTQVMLFDNIITTTIISTMIESTGLEITEAALLTM